LNEKLKIKFGIYIESSKGLLKNQLLELLNKDLPSDLYYGYFIENVKLEHIQLLLILIILEEFIQLTQLKKDKEKKLMSTNVSIETTDPQHFEYIIPFLTNTYNSICVATFPKPDKSANLYILLLSSMLNEADQKYERSKTLSMLNTFMQTAKTKLRKKQASDRSWFTPLHHPKIETHRQVPFEVISKFVKALDKDRD